MTARQHISPTKRLRIFEDAGGRCHICTRKIRPGEKWEVEHRRALGLLGKDDESNMAPAHLDCHSQKTRVDKGQIARAKRRAAKHNGIRKRGAFPCGRGTPWKRTVDGRTVPR